MDDRSIDAWSDYEASIAPPAAAAARVRARLDRVLAARGGVSPESRDDARASAPRAAAAILVIKSSLISVTIAAATLGGLHVGARAIAPPAELPARTTASAAEPDVPAPMPTPATIAAPPQAAPTTATEPVATVEQEPSPATRRAAASPRAGAPTRADRLAEELALVDPAREALARGDEATALRLFGEHAQRFPAGALAPERDAYTTMARCKRAARERTALLAAFERAHAGSSLLERVRDACRDSATDSRARQE